jgi:hypothetical protein
MSLDVEKSVAERVSWTLELRPSGNRIEPPGRSAGDGAELPQDSGHEDLWVLKTVLDEGRLISEQSQNPSDEDRVAA